MFGGAGAALAPPMPPAPPPPPPQSAEQQQEEVAAAWRHVRGVVRDASRSHDLLDLLQNARREETYSFPMPGVSVWTC
jgi:hypothetical protein